MTTCLEIVPGCHACETHPLATTPHVCDDLCEFTGQRKRGSESFHRLIHEPRRHACGTVLDDRRGNNYETHRLCPYRTCVVLLCPGCRRITGGWGPVECRACNGPDGHGTYGELRRPGAGRRVKRSLRRRR